MTECSHDKFISILSQIEQLETLSYEQMRQILRELDLLKQDKDFYEENKVDIDMYSRVLLGLVEGGKSFKKSKNKVITNTEKWFVKYIKPWQLIVLKIVIIVEVIYHLF